MSVCVCFMVLSITLEMPIGKRNRKMYLQSSQITSKTSATAKRGSRALHEMAQHQKFK